MKLKKYLYIILTIVIVGLLPGCKKVLVEQPYTVFTIEYLKTPAGIQNAVNALYSGMRFDYGPMGALLTMNNGTDELTSGDQGFNATSEAQLGDYSINSSNGHILTPWNRNFSNINLANAVIQFAPNADMPAAAKTTIIAEARYLRGLYYFLLVQQFGAVPLDFGSGELTFNQSAFQGFNRLPQADLFVKNYKTIIEDFTYASLNLPDARPTTAFKLSKAAALHMLAKAYIYKAYSSAKDATDFKNGWAAAKTLIDNPGRFGVSLLQNYADVHKEGNDYNAEILYSVERVPGDGVDNEVNNVSTEFTGKANMSNNFFNCNYQNNVAVPAGSGKFPIDRVIQYGRPLRQLCPNPYVYNIAFLDKTNDSRYDNTFRTVFLATNANSASVGINIGDTAYFLAPFDWYADSLTALGTKKYRIVAPREFYLPGNPAIALYPSIKKYDDNTRTNVNDCSGRPFVVAKFSEVYLLAAEAAIQDGRPGDALPLILTLRQRAAFRTGLTSTELTNRQALMAKKNIGTSRTPVWADLTTGDMTLDFIMEERTRELFGESIRWADLACRGLLVDRVKKYNALAGPKVQAFHALRPIPQSQLDAMNDPNKTQYQNPGY